MWMNTAKQVISRGHKSHSASSRAYSFLVLSQNSIFPEKFEYIPLEMVSRLKYGERRHCEISLHGDFTASSSFGCLRNQFCPKGYASVTEAVSSTDVEEDMSVVDEVQDLLRENRQKDYRQQNVTKGVANWKYNNLRRRQVKNETEAWKVADKGYRELLMDMCERKLAPNLPYIKSLFLGCFEPTRDVIAKEQELCRLGKNRATYAPYFDQLPADMMAVIAMHKLMEMLMTGGEHGSARSHLLFVLLVRPLNKR